MQSSLFAGLAAVVRGGTTYGWTRTRAVLPRVATGSESGVGLRYGAGAGINGGPAGTLQGNSGRDRLNFASDKRDVYLWAADVTYRC